MGYIFSSDPSPFDGDVKTELLQEVLEVEVHESQESTEATLVRNSNTSSYVWYDPLTWNLEPI